MTGQSEIAGAAPGVDDAVALARRDRALLRQIAQAPSRQERAKLLVHAQLVMGVSRRTIERRLKRLRNGQPARRQRSDKGEKRVKVSRLYDRSVPFGADVLATIAAELWKALISITNSAIRSRAEVQRHLTIWLMARTRQEGFDLPLAQLKKICKVPIPRVRQARHYRLPHIRAQYPKMVSDKLLPRARRDRDGLWPWSVVCVDCTPLDITLEREDGSEYTARLVVFQDLASNAVFIYVVFPEVGRGVTQQHVIAAIVAFVQRYGMPGALLVDCGPEFRKLGVLDDLLKLSARLGFDRFAVHAAEDRPDLVKLLGDRLAGARSSIMRARRYNPETKPVEGTQGNLTRFIFSVIDAWHPGDFLNHPTKHRGRRAMPFRGTKQQLCDTLDEQVHYYMLLPQGGHLAGKSPQEFISAAIEGGYERPDVDVAGLLEYWATDHVCVPSQCEITIEKVGVYTHPKLGGVLPGTKVRAKVQPACGDRSRVAVFDEFDQLLCFAAPVERNHFLDPAGAGNVAHRTADFNRVIDDMEAETMPFDPIEARRRFVEMHREPSDAPSAGVIQMDRESRLTAKARRALPPPAESAALPQGNMRLWLPAPAATAEMEMTGGADPPAMAPASAEAGRSSKRRRR